MQRDLQPPAAERASYPPRSGNHVEILIDGEETFRAIGARIRNATKSIWVTVSFVDLAVAPFGAGRGTLLDVLDAAARRGVDVRLLFWWSEFPGIGSFRGEPEELALLAEKGVRVKMRWDHVPRGCHHQKSWVIDGAYAFVGGINLTADGCSDQNHDGSGHHDLFAAIRGPAVADVAENFIQRWNQASRTDSHGHAFPSVDVADALESSTAPEPAGSTTVQIVRTIRKGLYRGERGWHESHRFDLGDGESSIRETVHRWIEQAEKLVYVENQYLLAPETLERLRAAAARRVDVIVLCPYEPDPNLSLYPKEHLERSVEALDALAVEDRFGMFGLRRARESGSRTIYVHSKLLIVDDRLLSVGSANFWPPSYVRDSELNLCAWDPELAVATRRRLWREHLGESAGDTASEPGLDRWRRLAGNVERGARIAEIAPSAYYRFHDATVAPWSGIEPTD